MSRVVSGRSGLSDLTEAELPLLLPYKENCKDLCEVSGYHRLRCSGLSLEDQDCLISLRLSYQCFYLIKKLSRSLWSIWAS